ncbi:MAG TPA: LTA synthase family protein [Bacteroidales bacterium]|nr:LTA synthase family protein [Bacteroidales bacterium]
MKNWLFSRNIYIVLIYRILIILLLFSVSRAGFYVFNNKMFPGLTAGEFLTIMRGGLLFDISATVYINMVFILFQLVPFDFRYGRKYQKSLAWLFFITNGVAFAANTADFVYYRFVFKRATSDIFGTFEGEPNIIKMILRFLIDYWPATLFCIALWVVMVWLYRRLEPVKPQPSNRTVYTIVNILMIPLAAGLMIGGARGSLNESTRPISNSNAARYVKDPKNVAIVLNTPFSIFRTSGKKPLEKKNFFNDEELKVLFDPHHIPSGDKPVKSENVVVIILESFGREYIGALNRDLDSGKYSGYTPFIDSLINVSLTFDVSLANGKKSIDAMPSILASIPSLETPYAISHYSNNQIEGLASHLKKKGYYTTFFHGALSGSMGFDSFARMSGFEDYVSYEDYPYSGDTDGMWGIWDEPFFGYFAEKMKEFPQPFLASVFSLSSHHPFIVPEKYRNKFKKGPVPIAEVVGYTDFALGEFFRKISSEPFFENTLFVITADHTNESIHKEFQNSFGLYSVPVILYKPGSDLKGIKNRIAQQIDIMPTVLHYLNYDEEFIAFGNDLFDDSYEPFAFNTNGSTYHLYMRDHILIMIDYKPVGLYNYKSDKFLEIDLKEKEPDLLLLMENKLKAIIQSYNSRLIDNNMIVRKP